MKRHLFLEFWLVDTWLFADWRHRRAVTRLENVRQSNIWRGKKLGFQMSHEHPLYCIFMYLNHESKKILTEAISFSIWLEQ